MVAGSRLSIARRVNWLDAQSRWAMGMIQLAERAEKNVRVKDTEYRVGGRGRPGGVGQPELGGHVGVLVVGAVPRTQPLRM